MFMLLVYGVNNMFIFLHYYKRLQGSYSLLVIYLLPCTCLYSCSLKWSTSPAKIDEFSYLFGVFYITPQYGSLVPVIRVCIYYV